MITCPNCGQSAWENAQFCANCGALLHTTPPDKLITGSPLFDSALGFFGTFLIFGLLGFAVKGVPDGGSIFFGGFALVTILYFLLRGNYPAVARGIGFALLTPAALFLGLCAVCFAMLAISSASGH